VPDFVYIVWLPLTISAMAVMWVVALGAMGQPAPVPKEAHQPSASLRKED
jgi:hypothetical protein